METLGDDTRQQHDFTRETVFYDVKLHIFQLTFEHRVITKVFALKWTYTLELYRGFIYT